MKNLGDRGEAIRGAACVRDDVVLRRIVLVLVDAENDGDVLILCWSRNDDFFDTVVAVVDSESRVSEESGGFDDDVNASGVPRNVCRVLFSKNSDRLSVDR